MSSISFSTEVTRDGKEVPYVRVHLEHAFGEHTRFEVTTNVHQHAVANRSLARIQAEILEETIRELQTLVNVHRASVATEPATQAAAPQ